MAHAACSDLSLATAVGSMWDWGGNGTSLPHGFAELRMDTNELMIWARERALDGPKEGRCKFRHAVDPAQLLCRALRLAPVCYQRFVWAASDPTEQLHIATDFDFTCEHSIWSSNRNPAAAFDSVTQLATALQQYAAAEHITVSVSQDERSITVGRF